MIKPCFVLLFLPLMLGCLTHAQKADDPGIVLIVNYANRHFSDVTAAVRVHSCGWWMPCTSFHGTILLAHPMLHRVTAQCMQHTCLRVLQCSQHENEGVAFTV